MYVAKTLYNFSGAFKFTITFFKFSTNGTTGNILHSTHQLNTTEVAHYESNFCQNETYIFKIFQYDGDLFVWPLLF